MAEQFWYFFYYSFLGYLLEKAFAWLSRAPHRRRKCFLLLPLCPVYGLGMVAVLALPPFLRAGPWLIVSGAVVTTAVEYAVHWAYESLLGVRFWDYAPVRGNLNGRVCLPFTLSWGLLTALAIWAVQPLLAQMAAATPSGVSLAAMTLLTVDAVYTARHLALTGDVETLRAAVLFQGIFPSKNRKISS